MESHQTSKIPATPPPITYPAIAPVQPHINTGINSVASLCFQLKIGTNMPVNLLSLKNKCVCSQYDAKENNNISYMGAWHPLKTNFLASSSVGGGSSLTRTPSWRQCLHVGRNWLVSGVFFAKLIKRLKLHRPRAAPSCRVEPFFSRRLSN